MKPRTCCTDYNSVKGFNFCPICGSKLYYSILITNNNHIEELWARVYDYTVNGQHEEDRSRIRWLLKQSGIYNFEEDIDIESFCEYCFEFTEEV